MGADAVNIIEGIKAIGRIEGIDMGTRGAIASNNFCYRPTYACMSGGVRCCGLGRRRL